MLDILRIALEILRKNEFCDKLKKGEFLQEKMMFLGHMISNNGV